MSGYENTVSHNANFQPIDPADQLVANGQLQRVKMVESAGFGSRLDLPLNSLEPIQVGIAKSQEGDDINLVSVIEVGESMLGILDKKPHEGYASDYEMDSKRFMLADVHVAPDKDRNPVFSIAIDTKTGRTSSAYIDEPDTTTIFGSNRKSRIFDKLNPSVGKMSPFEDQLRFRFTEEGFLHVEAAGSGADVSVLARPKSDPDRKLVPNEVQQLREITGLNDEGIIDHVPDFSKPINSKAVTEIDPSSEIIEPLQEFILGEARAIYLGRVELKSNNGGYVFESVDYDGVSRRFFVYQSNSEGGWRVSQGLENYKKDGEIKTRFMKGPENKFNSQYTQDTKLAPELEEVVDKLQQQGDGDLSPLWRSVIEIPNQEVDAALDDFEDVVATYNLLQSEEALDAISWLRAGNMVTDHLRVLFGLPEDSSDDDVEKVLLDQVEIVNNELRDGEIIPELTEPTHITLDIHPKLGNIKKEFFTKNVGGHEQQWVFAQDDSGRVWIDRIRYADGKITPYGTDAEMLDSGFLTSKPIDYTDQITAIPESMVSQVGSSGYSDITKFIDLFEPIKKYRAQRGVFRK